MGDLFFFFKFPRTLRGICSDLNGIGHNSCPSQESPPTLFIFIRKATAARRDKLFSKIRYFFSLRHAQRNRTEICSLSGVVLLTLSPAVQHAVTPRNLMKAPPIQVKFARQVTETTITNCHLQLMYILKKTIIMGHKLASY